MSRHSFLRLPKIPTAAEAGASGFIRSPPAIVPLVVVHHPFGLDEDPLGQAEKLAGGVDLQQPHGRTACMIRSVRA